MEAIKIESYLPVFSGFYNTIFEFDNEDDYIEEGKTYDDYEWDYVEYHTRIAKACVNWVENELKEFGIIGVEFQSLVSPKYYNYSNDSINVEYTVQTFDLIDKYLKENELSFAAYIREHYTSCSGFISSHSNNSKAWLEAYKADKHKFGSVLNFILFNEKDDAQMDMYYGTDSERYINCELKQGE